MDLATDNRSVKLRSAIMEPGGVGEAMLELIEEIDPIKTKMAARVRKWQSDEKQIIEFVETKRRLIRSIAADGFDPTLSTITVYMMSGTDQVWSRDGIHRTASLLMLGRSVPSTLVNLGTPVKT